MAFDAVAFNDPVMFTLPVILCTSVIALPIFVPVFVTWNSTPLPFTTVNEPDTINEPVIVPPAKGR